MYKCGYQLPLHSLNLHVPENLFGKLLIVVSLNVIFSWLLVLGYSTTMSGISDLYYECAARVVL